MYPKIEKLIKEYFLDECLSINLEGETDKDYSAELLLSHIKKMLKNGKRKNNP